MEVYFGVSMKNGERSFTEGFMHSDSKLWRRVDMLNNRFVRWPLFSLFSQITD